MKLFNPRGSMVQGTNPPAEQSRELVRTTQDSTIFNFVNGNRAINESNLKNLYTTIKESGILRPIIVNSNKDVIDGQHRLTTARELNKMGFTVDIPYIVADDYDIDEVVALNTDQKPLSKKEWVEMWADKGKKDYQALKNLNESYQVALLTIAKIAKTDPSINNEGFIKNQKIDTGEIESGDFIIADKQWTIDFLDYVTQFTEHGLLRRPSDSFTKALYDLCRFPEDHFDRDRFYTQLSSYKEKYEGLDNYNKAELFQKFDEIYNYNRKTDNRLRLQTYLN